MDKYEYQLKLDQLKNLVAAKDFETAAQIADSINWRKVRNSKTLMMVADVYEALGQYEPCKEVLLQAYDHSSIGRNIINRLAEVAIKAKNVVEAEEFYSEFLEIAPKDNQRYVIAYKISCLKDAPLTDRIAILEELKEKEYTEMWAYELAALYGQAGMREKCVETCDELILWFGDGEYVEKALDLKRGFQPLTPSQEKKYQRFRSQRGMVEITVPKKVEAKISEESGLPEITVTASKFNTQNLQDELAKSMKQIMEATEKDTVSDTMDSIKKIVSDIPYLQGNAQEETPVFDPEEINEKVDEELRSDFQELLGEEMDGQISLQIPEDTIREQQVEGQMSIEEVLAEWEKTKRAAEVAIAAAEQKKLDMAKEQALAEAGEIMNRLKALLPLLSATPGEDIPETPETVAETLVPTENTDTTKQKIPEDTERENSDGDLETNADLTAGLESTGHAAENDAENILTENVPDATDDFSENMPDEEVIPPVAVQETSPAETKRMPDMSGYTTTEEQAVTFEEPEEDVGLQKILATATQTMMENSDLEIPVSGGMAPEDMPFVTQTELPEIVMPDGLENAQNEETGAPETDGVNVEAGIGKETPYNSGESETESVDGKTGIPDAGKTSAEELEDTGSLMPDDEALESALEEEFWDEPAEEEPAAEEPQEDGILTAQERELFSYFLPVPGMEAQITRVLENAPKEIGHSITSLRGNLIIQGEEGSGKTVLATSLIKAIQRVIGREDAKIGKISAEALNRKDFAALVPKMQGGFLIVDKAGNLTAETAARMSQVMSQNTQGLVVILEDNSAGIKRALSLDFSFAKKFTEKVKIPIFTIDELVDFGKSYANEMECVIEEMGVLALYNRINNIQKLDHPTTLAEVKEIVDQAIESAEGGGIKKLFAKKYDDNDYLILREKDFE